MGVGEILLLVGIIVLVIGCVLLFKSDDSDLVGQYMILIGVVLVVLGASLGITLGTFKEKGSTTEEKETIETKGECSDVDEVIIYKDKDGNIIRKEKVVTVEE